ncbi:MAG: methyltransferase domain-containing protein [candidate division KSB1 bacterium]|nr:methyltransferase domain-containing protein [candidate division KSB1 bacterium]
MNRNSRRIQSNQQFRHEKLYDTLDRTRQTTYRKPVPDHTRNAFEWINSKISNFDGDVILDSGCGTGESVRVLSRLHPDALIIGIDKSLTRIKKARKHPDSGNTRFIQAEYFDFWRLAVQNEWTIKKHYILYPNPWPKKQHLRRRIHGHPAFGCLMHLGNEIELRSNWSVYVQEFSIAVHYITGKKAVWTQFEPETPLTLFEQKYMQSGHALFRCTFHPGEDQ